MTMIQQNIDIAQPPVPSSERATPQPEHGAATCDVRPTIDFYGHDLTGVSLVLGRHSCCTID
eukprot:COSAG02_NODE_2609_length_8435_cov_4.723129_3_plen_62_part_00